MVDNFSRMFQGKTSQTVCSFAEFQLLVQIFTSSTIDEKPCSFFGLFCDPEFLTAHQAPKFTVPFVFILVQAMRHYPVGHGVS